MDNGLSSAFLSAGLCMGMAAIGGALGIGLLMFKALESMARQPEASNELRPMIFIGIAFIEAIALYALVISILLVTKH